MKTTYGITGMHCEKCVAKITEAIKSVAGVGDVKVSLKDKTASVTSDQAIALPALQEAVTKAGDYTLTETETAASSVAEDKPPESLYPLVLIVGYIVGVVVLIAAATGNWSAEPMMRHFMAGFFLVFSFFKLLDLPGFVSAYRGYDLPAKAWEPWAWAYPFVEMALGVAYLLAWFPLITNAVTLVIMLIGSAGVLRALLGKRHIACACLGTALNLPMTKVTLIEDLTMAVMAAAMLVMVAG